MLNCWKPFITNWNYAETYYQTLEEVRWLLRLEKPRKWQILKNLEKIVL